MNVYFWPFDRHLSRSNRTLVSFATARSSMENQRSEANAVSNAPVVFCGELMCEQYHSPEPPK